MLHQMYLYLLSLASMEDLGWIEQQPEKRPNAITAAALLLFHYALRWNHLCKVSKVHLTVSTRRELFQIRVKRSELGRTRTSHL